MLTYHSSSPYLPHPRIYIIIIYAQERKRTYRGTGNGGDTGSFNNNGKDSDYRVIAADFDGTLCEHRFPEIGEIKPVHQKIIDYIKSHYAVQNEKTMQLQTGIGGSVSATAVLAGMTINGVEYKEKEPATKALLESCKGITDKKMCLLACTWVST